MKTILILLFLSACAGSDDDQDQEPVDPTGNWDLSLVFTNGSCGIEGAEVTQLWTVTQTGESSYVLATSLSQDLVDIDGTFFCDPEGCDTSAVLVYSDGVYREEDSYNLFLGADDVIDGDGSAVVVTPDGSCTQAFSVTGNRQ